GDISFGGLGQKTGKYVRVSSDTSCESLYQLMTEHWKLRSPNLLISVTGGAKNFYIKTHLKDKFRRGLIKVAQTTGAWILTGGTHAGVMKHVGMAVRDYTLSSGLMEGQIVVIGVAPWGVIHNRHALVHPEGCFPAYYALDEQGQGRLSCLDINHTHFLLVDDGTHGHYGVEIELRARLEKLISQQSLGKRGTIYNAMLKHTPCVVLEGSGRLADVIAQVAALPVSKVTLVLINQLMKRFFGQECKSFTEVQVIEWTKKVTDKNIHFITISDSFGGQNMRNVSNSITKFELLNMFFLSLELSCGDVFSISFSSQSCDLHPAMFSALVGDKPEFVRVLLENGVCVRKFLEHEDTLCELYAHLPCYQKSRCDFFIVQVPSKGLVDLPCSGEDWTPDTVWDPGRDLFLWAVVQNNTELAEIGWEQCRDCIAAALAASKILRKLAQESGEDDSEEAKEMRELASHYEKQAIGVFSDCHSWDAQRAQKLLIRISPSWGRSTCLWLALEADAKSFIAHSGVQVNKPFLCLLTEKCLFKKYI
uniref:Transient receptor potential cation channel, subfamily M, member 2 n=1 Tax=Sinocyclocheilus anshuiensis TaxID=1608454 RepID=A0A671N6H1_9TELE